jgi:tetratricopeptide (TPR) repeat protein
VLLPGEVPSAVKVAPHRVVLSDAADDRATTPMVRAAPVPDADIDLETLTPSEARAMAEEVQLQDREKRRIIQLMRLVAGSDYFAVLGVARTADRRELKRAYFRLSKEFHPDRHYNQTLGSFGPWLSRIFETATQAWQVLSDDGRREEYAAALDAGGGQVMAQMAVDGSGPTSLPRAASTQGRSQHAAELFARACDTEVGGDRVTALTLFRAAIRVDAQPRYLRRAAACALAAGELGEAEGYARRAVDLRTDDASYARVLADVLRGAGRLAEAEDVLVRALELRSSRDALARELEGDLTRVRSARRAAEPPPKSPDE